MTADQRAATINMLVAVHRAVGAVGATVEERRDAIILRYPGLGRCFRMDLRVEDSDLSSPLPGVPVSDYLKRQDG